jgi:hypothetical protein
MLKEWQANRIGKKVAKKILTEKEYKKFEPGYKKFNRENLKSYTIGNLTKKQREENKSFRNQAKQYSKNPEKLTPKILKSLKSSIYSHSTIVNEPSKRVTKRIKDYVNNIPELKGKVRFVQGKGREAYYAHSENDKTKKISRRTIKLGHIHSAFHELGHLHSDNRIKVK